MPIETHWESTDYDSADSDVAYDPDFTEFDYTFEDGSTIFEPEPYLCPREGDFVRHCDRHPIGEVKQVF